MDTTKAEFSTLDSIFHAALEIGDLQERLAFLKSACGSDSRLRERVDSLLEADGKADDLFKTADVIGSEALNAQTTPQPTMPGEGSGTRIGRYRLLQKIGEGGFGTVWMAEQTEPVKRRVALKIIKLGMDTREVIVRFEAERQALAMMDHPNIAKVFDGGATEGGRPFFVMELVRGIPITEFCDQHCWGTRQRLGLFIEICRAVQHAHQKGIIHRDLKPSNVMVTMHDGRAVPKVIDFGVAKATQADLTDKTLYTRYEQFIGTPAYMSPEQAHLGGLDIDTRSDIYSLGVLLYELLTGRTPFDPKDLQKAGYDEIRRVIREEEPPKPSTRVNTLGDEALTDLARHRQASPDKLEGMLRGDLDWIIMMALEKDRTRRYDTAIGLAADIQNHLDDQPVTAAAPGALYRATKYIRRHRRALAGGVSLAVLAIAAGGTIVWQAIEASSTVEELERIEGEQALAELAERSRELVSRGRRLNLRAVALEDWAQAREILEEYLEDQSDFKTLSYDEFKLAAVCLITGDLEAYDATCNRMLDAFEDSTIVAHVEHTVRAYFSVPRLADDPVTMKVRQMAFSEIDHPAPEWMQLARGMVEYRLGNYAEAQVQLAQSIRTANPKLQANVRSYLAMTTHKLGDDAAAGRYLSGAEQILKQLEASRVSIYWHERVFGRLAFEEARKLIAGE